jgi:hypothetical protein
VNLFDSELWPFVALAAVFAIVLVGRWLRGEAVEDPGEGRPHEALGDDAAAEEREAEGRDDSADADLALEDYDDEDDVAALGVSADDRQELLERLADDGALALIWSPPPEPGQPPEQRVVQRDHGDGTATMPVFTSARKAFAYLHVLGPKAVARAQWYDTMPVDAAFLVQGEFEVVINPGSPYETALSAEDRDTLADRAGVEEREPTESLPPLGEDDALGENDVPGEDGDTPPSDR